MTIRLDQFVSQIVDSTLISADEVAALIDSLPAEKKPQDGEQLAKELVRLKRLTAYQAQQIYAGKGRSLVLGEYVILDKLGQGGMGLVLKAEHRRMERLVALKVLSPKVTKSLEALRRFQREVKAAARLTHPNIVIAHDAGEAGGTHFLVTEYVDGGDLSSRVKKDGPLPLEQALDCILQAARGLQYAHEHGVIHRDIKPANLLLDRQGTVKILDMGLARLDSAGSQQDQLTGTGQIMGTVDFMPPEQAMDTKHADARADIYSLGVTLWYLLTGRPMYAGETTVEKLMAHQTKPIPSLREACPKVPPALDAVFHRMVAKTPLDRYQTMAEVIAELEPFCRPAASGPARSPSKAEDSQLDAFLRGLGPSAGPRRARRTSSQPSPAAVKTKAAPAPPADPDVTQDWSEAHAETATKMEPSLPRPEPAQAGTTSARSAAVRRSKPARAGSARRPPWWQDWRALAAAGAGGLLVILLGVWVVVRDKEGKEVARVPVPEGGSVTVETAKEKEAAPPQGKSGEGYPLAPPRSKDSLLDRLEASQMPDPDPPVAKDVPLVAVYGGPPLPHWRELGGLAYTPDGKTLISAGCEGIVKYWDAASGRLERTLPNVGDLSTSSVAISPDGQSLAVGKSFQVKILDTRTGAMRLSLPVDSGGVTSVAFSPDSKTLAGYRYDPSLNAEIVLWNMDSGKKVKAEPAPWASEGCVAFSPDGTLLAAAVGKPVKIYDVVAGQWQQTLERHTSRVRTIVFSPDGKTLASGGDGGKVILWDTSTWRPRQELQGHSSYVFALAFSPDGKILASADSNQKILLWEDGRQRILNDGYVSATRRAHPIKLAFSPDGRSLAWGCDGMLQVWDVATGSGRAFPDQVQSGGHVPSVAFSADGHSLVFAQGNGVTSIDLVTGQASRFADGQTSPTSSLAVGGDRQTIAWGTMCGQVHVWDGVTGRSRQTVPAHPTYEVYAVAISPDGQTIASAAEDARIAFWDARTGAERQTLTKNQLAGALGFSVDGRRLAAYCFDGHVQLIDLSQGKEVPGPPDRYTNWRSIVFNPDGKTYGVMSDTLDLLRIHDAFSGEELRRVELAIPGGVGVRALAYSPDGSLLAATTTGGTVFLFDTRSWKIVKQYQLGPGRGLINGVSFSADGRYLATANGNGTVYVLRLNEAAPRGAAAKPDSKPKEPSGTAAAKPVPPWNLPAGSPPPAIAPFNAAKAKEHQAAWAKYLGVPVEMENSIGIKFVLIPPGEFDMGSTDEAVAKLKEEAKAKNFENWYIEHLPAEAPKHRVRITRPFWLGVHEVTRGQFRRFVDDRGYQTGAERDGKGGYGLVDGQWKQDRRFVWNGDLGFEQADDHPVVNVTWKDVTAFCAWLSEKEGEKSHLPSEAQWEYACRAGTTTPWYSVDDEESLKEYEWFSANAKGKTHPVGQKWPNAWGLYDMQGSVGEWCQDGWGERYYATSPMDDPSGASGGSFRVNRGGSWGNGASNCRASFRYGGDPGDRNYRVGFRLARTVSSSASR